MVTENISVRQQLIKAAGLFVSYLLTSLTYLFSYTFRDPQKNVGWGKFVEFSITRLCFPRFCRHSVCWHIVGTQKPQSGEGPLSLECRTTDSAQIGNSEISVTRP